MCGTIPLHSFLLPLPIPFQFLSKMNFIQAATNIRAVSYTNDHSVNSCAYKDLELGHIHGKVGCNSSVFGCKKTKSGDIVMIMARNKNKTYFTIGVLGERLESCSLWSDNGGENWKYNFSYSPLTPIVELTKDLHSKIIATGEKYNCNGKNFLNSRFCSIKLKPIFQEIYMHLVPAARSSL